MRQVSKEQAQGFMAYIGETFTPNTYNKYLAFFRTFWRVVKEDAKLTADPWEKFIPKPLATHTRRELTVEELARVIASVSGELRVLFAIGIYTGLRLGDAVRLGWGNVDMVKKVISLVPHKTARTGARVYIPLHPVLAQVLAEDGGKHMGRIIPGLAALYDKDESTLSKKIQAVFAGCGITTNGTKEGRSLASVDVGFHSLRHTYVSMCANAGVPLSVVQAIVGHGNPAMTEHYVHVSQNALQSVLHALPAIGGADARPEAGNATAGRVGALQEVLDRLGGLDGAELAEVVAKAQELRSEK
jgi:integrase